MQPPPTSALQVAFTAAGLEALGVATPVLAAFSPEFLSGMTRTEPLAAAGRHGSQRAFRVGMGRSHRRAAPRRHVLRRRRQARGARAETTGAAWKQAFEPLHWLGTADLDGIEPFGFADGISQPQIDWDQQRNPRRAQVTYSNVVALGEFLLGYRNEYAKFTDRPLVRRRCRERRVAAGR